MNQPYYPMQQPNQMQQPQMQQPQMQQPQMQQQMQQPQMQQPQMQQPQMQQPQMQQPQMQQPQMQQPMQQGFIAPPQQQLTQQGFYAPPQQMAPQQMQGPQAGAMVQASGPPVLYQIDDAAALEEYTRVREELRSGGLAGFLNVPGPNGESNWDSVRQGYEGSVLVYICGPWAPGKDFKVMQSSHFFKSAAHPQGNSVPHVEGCRFCAALNAAPKEQAERLKPWKRVRTRYLYNVCWLENLAAHYQGGAPQSMIFGATKTAHTALGTLFQEAGGASKIIDYQTGRPVRIIKRKTGPQAFDVEWTAVATFQSQPLPQEFWPVASNLVDLEKLVKDPTDEEINSALAELGVASVPLAQSYHPGAQPPHGSPYEVQSFQQPQMQQPQMQQQMQQPQMQQPPNYSAPPASQPPPSMPTPPPVTSGAAPQSQYQPQPAVQQPGAMAPGAQVAQVQPDVPRQLTYPLSQGTQLPDGRERCYGSYDGGVDGWCGNCPDWLKNQCAPVSQQVKQGAAQQQSVQVNAELQALQNQMVGAGT